MPNEYDALLSNLFNNVSGKNLNTLKTLLSNEDNRRILASVIPDSAKAKRAVESAQRGDSSQARTLIEQLAATPGGSELISNIMRALEGKNNG